MSEWSEWLAFPNPKGKGYLAAPFGPGVYELRNSITGELVLFGRGKHCAARMSSLLPDGAGTRNNERKRAYVLEHLAAIEYRTRAFESEEEAVAFEARLRSTGGHLYPT